MAATRGPRAGVPRMLLAFVAQFQRERVEHGEPFADGTLNLYVAYTFPTDFWVNFKLFGGMGLMLLFIVGQALWLSKYIPEDEAPSAANPKEEPKA